MAKTHSTRASTRRAVASGISHNQCDLLSVDLTEIEASILSAVAATEHRGPLLDGVATMLRMSGLRACRRAKTILGQERKS